MRKNIKILNLLDFSNFLEVSKTKFPDIFRWSKLSAVKTKIAIARALFNDPQILIFDECLILNKEQEELILENIL